MRFNSGNCAPWTYLINNPVPQTSPMRVPPGITTLYRFMALLNENKAMPDGRPAIPTDTVRLVRTRAGHRCSVDGATAALEIAHIIDWANSQDHSADNLGGGGGAADEQAGKFDLAQDGLSVPGRNG